MLELLLKLIILGIENLNTSHKLANLVLTFNQTAYFLVKLDLLLSLFLLKSP
jgi:hypothetical protein